MQKHEQFWQDLKSGKFASMVCECAKGQQLSNSSEVYNIMKPLFAQHRDVESFYCIFMDAKNHIIFIEKMFSGSIASAPVYPREVVKRLIALQASALIAAHNHPTGDTTPSREDMAITSRIYLAAACIDVKLHDHMIVGNGYLSMADNGMVNEIASRFDALLRSNWNPERRTV
jgi:DNA repair protein RadC